MHNFEPSTVRYLRKIIFGVAGPSTEFMSSHDLIRLLFTGVGVYSELIYFGYSFNAFYEEGGQEIIKKLKEEKAGKDTAKDEVDEEEDT